MNIFDFGLGIFDSIRSSIKIRFAMWSYSRSQRMARRVRLKRTNVEA